MDNRYELQHKIIEIVTDAIENKRNKKDVANQVGAALHVYHKEDESKSSGEGKELPSDEDIFQKSYKAYGDLTYSEESIHAFNKGAKWMRKKIKQI